MAKDDVTPQDIFRLTGQGPDERAIVAKYCIQDCNLVFELLKKIDIITEFIEMAKLCSVPIDFLVMRGQGIKITSFIAKKCREKNTLMPVIEKAEGEDGYEGAIVLEPKSGLYLDDPVACVDYSSLYPSSMISENLCHSSKVLTKEYDLDGNLIKETGDEDYDNLEGYEYVDVEYDTFTYVRKTPKAAATKVKTGTKHCRFAQYPNGEKAILPSVLSELLAARKATKKLKAKETNPFMANVYDKRQLSIKLTANSLYGQTGARTSTFYEPDVAASTTATGRKLLTYAKRVIEEVYGDTIMESNKYGKVKSNAKYIYGDTDSVFFCFYFTELDGTPIKGFKALDMTIELAQEVGEVATKFLKNPHDLEYEKTFLPFCLLSKKRYVGMLHELDPNDGKRKSMGIVLKRRDNAPIVKDVYGGIIDILMKDKDIAKAIQYLQGCLQNIVDEKYGMEKLIITKSLRSTYKNPDQIAHKVLADRIAKRDPGNKPKSGDRIPFVYVIHPNKKAKQGEKIELPSYILEHPKTMKIDYAHYISNQIMKPVLQVFALVLDELPGFKNKLGKQRRFYKDLESHKSKLTEEKYKEKEEKLKNKEVKTLLFDKYLRMCRKDNSTSIKDMFNNI
jgi:DNA polymerase delta subunit 1